MGLQINQISILIVDDSEHVRALLTMLMKKAGVLTIHQAIDGESAVTKYKELKPSLMFLDNMLPKLPGLEVLKKVREFDPAAKVIMVSAVSTPDIVQEAKNCGASYYVIKPYSPQKVVEIMKKVLNIQDGSAV